MDQVTHARVERNTLKRVSSSFQGGENDDGCAIIILSNDSSQFISLIYIGMERCNEEQDRMMENQWNEENERNDDDDERQGYRRMRSEMEIPLANLTLGRDIAFPFPQEVVVIPLFYKKQACVDLLWRVYHEMYFNTAKFHQKLSWNQFSSLSSI